MIKYKWEKIHEDLETYTYIDVLYLGPMYLMRTYRWCTETDTMKDLQVKEIDWQSARCLIDDARAEQKKGSLNKSEYAETTRKMQNNDRTS